MMDGRQISPPAGLSLAEALAEALAQAMAHSVCLSSVEPKTADEEVLFTNRVLFRSGGPSRRRGTASRRPDGSFSISDWGVGVPGVPGRGGDFHLIPAEEGTPPAVCFQDPVRIFGLSWANTSIGARGKRGPGACARTRARCGQPSGRPRGQPEAHARAWPDYGDI